MTNEKEKIKMLTLESCPTAPSLRTAVMEDVFGLSFSFSILMRLNKIKYCQ